MFNYFDDNIELNGWLNIYKEKGYTSNEVIRFIKKKFSLKKIGHYGTLDPLASGVLPVAIGEATKTIQYITNNFKEYTFMAIWGEETDSCDAEGVVIKRSSIKPKKNDIEDTIKKYFLGNILQKPPIFSAVKVKGKRAYRLARANVKFELGYKKINVYDFQLIENEPKKFSKFSIKCSPGTYIRAIVRDLAHRLGTFGYASEIVRKENSFFNIDNSNKLQSILKADFQNFIRLLLPVDFAIKNYPKIEIEKKYSDMIKHGKVIYVNKYKDIINNKNKCFLIICNNRLVSIANLEKGYIIPRRNFIN